MSSEYFDPSEARTARPVRHTDRRVRGDVGRYRDDDGLPLRELPTLGEIERRIMRCDDELAELVEDHYKAAEEAAAAEADWKQHRDRVLVALADSGTKEAADIREARAKRTRIDPRDPESAIGEDLYRLYKILEAREKSIDRNIRAIQTRMTGLMSVARGIRGQT
jgi:hypothetical protein